MPQSETYSAGRTRLLLMNFISIASSGFAAKGSYNLQPMQAKITERDNSYYRRNISFADSKTIEAEQNRQVLGSLP